jgi:hypothetical protein
MDVAEQILELAKRLVRQEQQIRQLTREHQKTLAEYRKLVSGLTEQNGARATAPTEQPCGASLRERIFGHLKQNAGVRLHLAEIERAVGVNAQDEHEHRRTIWTLANMRRDGVIRREGRGLWLVSREDGVEDYQPPQGDAEDIPF